MSQKLRVFVSSTMNDLANERHGVCEKLRSFNFEPVNAKNWHPSGSGSWDRISQEIASSHVFVLILGERYGWIPKKGPQSHLGLSVTHLEYNGARDLGLPVLPFLKRLDYDTDRESDDAKKRDEFRKEVADWAEGQVMREFDLADDLAGAAGKAVLNLVTDEYLAGKIRERAPMAAEAYRTLDIREEVLEDPGPIEIPERLKAAVTSREAVLFAGAGVSLSAGLPSANAMTQHLAQLLGPDYHVSASGAAFAATASDVEAATSREDLLGHVASLLDPPLSPAPTTAHLEAVRLFDLIVTTNWDSLFERAAADRGADLEVVTEEIDSDLPDRAIVKFHGSVGTGQSLLLTETDILALDRTRPRLWKAICDLFRRRTIVVTGSSLRDPSLIRLLDEADPQTPGYFVAPGIFETTEARLRRWKLQCISADADSFFTELAESLRAQ